eukprot:TRINITY_DN38937_c0_g1_i1.p1 TRINITY_DN38937_c0_g1~~TRINITY_DN38937_c0_g1_i1.p1  ORF type:complete len:279 (-),score=10.30 TRINITY_DN38937_c0_g1_i1:234-1070(-)
MAFRKRTRLATSTSVLDPDPESAPPAKRAANIAVSRELTVDNEKIDVNLPVKSADARPAVSSTSSSDNTSKTGDAGHSLPDAQTALDPLPTKVPAPSAPEETHSRGDDQKCSIASQITAAPALTTAPDAPRPTRSAPVRRAPSPSGPGAPEFDFDKAVCKDFLTTGFCAHGLTCRYAHYRDGSQRVPQGRNTWHKTAARLAKGGTVLRPADEAASSGEPTTATPSGAAAAPASGRGVEGEKGRGVVAGKALVRGSRPAGVATRPESAGVPGDDDSEWE